MNRITPSEVEKATKGRYEVLSLIGEGGMGAVFLARHRELGSRVAIKILPPDVRFSPDRLARFRREASLSAQMSHPNLVPTIECSVEGELAYLVMPYVDGVPLDTHLEHEGTMSLEDVRDLVRQIGGALTFAHNRGIIHRDIKPANILFEKDTKRWLVTDFGVAHVSTDTATLTRSGASIGTPAYMAPEQLGGAAEVDARADLYSLAAVAVEALTGGRPQAMAGVGEIAEAISQARPEVPHSLAQALAAPFAVAREERPKSVEEWLATLEQRKRRTPAWRVAVGAVAALLVTWVGWTAFRGRDTPVGDSVPVVAVLPFAVSGTSPGINLDSLLPHAFTWQLQTLPGHSVLHPADVRSQITRRFGGGPFTKDSLLRIAPALRADQALIGEVTAGDGTVNMRVEVFDVARQRIIGGADTLGPVDSLHAMVSGLVIDACAGPITDAPSHSSIASSSWTRRTRLRTGSACSPRSSTGNRARRDRRCAPHWTRPSGYVAASTPSALAFWRGTKPCWWMGTSTALSANSPKSQTPTPTPSMPGSCWDSSRAGSPPSWDPASVRPGGRSSRP